MAWSPGQALESLSVRRDNHFAQPIFCPPDGAIHGVPVPARKVPSDAQPSHFIP